MIVDLIKENREKIIFTSMISALSGVANIGLIKLVNDYVIAIEDMSRSIMIYCGLMVLMVVISFISQQLLSVLSAKIFYRIRTDMVHKISALSCEQLESIGGHRLYAALSSDINSINQLITILPGYIYNLTIIIAATVYMSYISGDLSLIIWVFFIIGFVVTKVLIYGRANRLNEEIRNIRETLYSHFQAIINGHKELKFNKHRKNEYCNERIDETLNLMRDKSVTVAMFWNFSTNWNMIMFFSAIGVVVFLSHSVLTISSTVLLQFIFVFLYMMGPILAIVNSFRPISQAKVAFNKLKQIRLIDNNVLSSDGELTVKPRDFESLELHDVHYQYVDNNDNEFSVGPISLQLKRGEIVYFIGGNGSGKTTAAKLLTGLYRPQQGTVFLNDEQITSKRVSFYNNYFSVIFPDYYLFDRVKDKYSEPIEDEAIRDYLKKLKLDHLVTVENGQLSTTKLSQGQRKRLALLIAYFEDAEIYVFDEWAAEQDPIFREFFYSELLEDLREKGKTLVVVTHDDRYFHLADKVVKFEFGKIISITDGNGKLSDNADEKPAIA